MFEVEKGFEKFMVYAESPNRVIVDFSSPEMLRKFLSLGEDEIKELVGPSGPAFTEKLRLKRYLFVHDAINEKLARDSQVGSVRSNQFPCVECGSTTGHLRTCSYYWPTAGEKK